MQNDSFEMNNICIYNIHTSYNIYDFDYIQNSGEKFINISNNHRTSVL